MQKIITIITKHHKITSIYTKRSNDPTYTCVQMCVCAMWSNNNNNKKKMNDDGDVDEQRSSTRKNSKEKTDTNTNSSNIQPHSYTYLTNNNCRTRTRARTPVLFCKLWWGIFSSNDNTIWTKKDFLFCFVCLCGWDCKCRRLAFFYFARSRSLFTYVHVFRIEFPINKGSEPAIYSLYSSWLCTDRINKRAAWHNIICRIFSISNVHCAAYTHARN